RGLWGETDTEAFTTAIRAILRSGQLIPASGQGVYPNGYGFQALTILLMSVTGISLSALQLYGASLLMPWIVIPSWLLFREWTGTARAATLATAVYLVQPEFLFPILCGTHEKFSRGLMIVGLYLLMRSLRSGFASRRSPRLVVLFYLVVFGTLAFNNL